MNQYTIYCTSEQTKKALDLDAPLRIIKATEEYQIRAINTIANGKNKEEYTLVDNMLINNPTAEQMISWLEEQHIYVLNYTHMCQHWYFAVWTDFKEINRDSRPSYKEAALVAIDAALEYLSKNKA